ncbi:MAG TPA: hypothetical protein PLB81_11670 [Deltaproteobacteria bacterium]|nr:hypothetical protein [Deltaproteobacteria bacterium]
MRKAPGVTEVLVLACMSLLVLTACATDQLSSAAATANAKLTSEALKAASGEIIIGTIKAVDTEANTIRLRDQTVTVAPQEIAKLKVGNKVKVTLAAGTMTAEKIVQLGEEEVKQAAKTKAREVKEQAIQTAIDKAVEMQSQQPAPGN